MPSTPDPLIEVIAAELRRTVEGGETVTDAAERILDAITATGRLLHRGVVVIATTEAAAGFEERTEWAVRVSDELTLAALPSRERAEHEMRFRTERQFTHPGTLVRRSVYIGPWEPAPDTTGTEEGA